MFLLKNKTIIIFVIFISYFLFSGFTPTQTIQSIELKNKDYITYKQNQINNNINECLSNIEINDFLDSFYFTIEQKEINTILTNYKNNLIKESSIYTQDGKFTIANNLLNSRLKYYQNDDTILNLINYNNSLMNDKFYEEYNGEVEHLSFNTLIAFPEKALDSKNNLNTKYDEDKITPYEFNKILNQLYQNNYILIKISDLYEIDNNKIIKKNLKLPKNKKPLLLSFDNVNYKSNYQNLGEIDKIIIDRNNNLATYTTKKSIQDRIQYDNEFIVILENFLLSHKDFSHNNARGIIFLTGNNGILGYNTSHKNASNKFESKRVLEVIKKLKSLGWDFGCNNYSYTLESNINDIEFAKELNLWNKEIRTLIGETPLYAYPYGYHNHDNTTKQELLQANGFKIFFTNSTTHNNKIFKDSIFLNRKFVGGKTLRENSDSFVHLFNCYSVYDHNNRIVGFYS